MAQLVNASIYGSNGQDWNKPQGVNRVFGVNQINVYPLQPTTGGTAVYSGVTCQTVVEVLPQGLQVNGNKYYTDKTVAALLAQGNAPLA